MLIHNKLAPKYQQREDIYISSTNGVLGFLKLSSINKAEVKRFIKFRKDTKILFDLLLTHMNTGEYSELANCMLIQLLEGLYRTSNKNSSDKLWEILEFYYKKNQATKMILSRRDLVSSKNKYNTPIFQLKAQDHRNYISHLNMNDNKLFFYKKENMYAYWKLCLTARVYIMQQLSLQVNKKELISIKKQIDKWAKTNKLKFKKVK